MAYKLVDPKESAQGEDRAQLCAMAIMAKAPRAGKVKTRLSPPLTLTETAALNICFLRDTGTSLASLSGSAPMVCYTPVGEESAFDDLFPGNFSLIPQRGEAFGERLFAAAKDILACGYGAVCLIDSDSPTVPKTAFVQAVQALARPGDRVVLGPSHDGGYYLIGLKVAHAEPFQAISWSTEHVAEQTRQRCVEAGLEVVELPLWYDVDDAATLAILEAELLQGKLPAFAVADGSEAKATKQFLQQRRSSVRPELASQAAKAL